MTPGKALWAPGIWLWPRSRSPCSCRGVNPEPRSHTENLYIAQTQMVYHQTTVKSASTHLLCMALYLDRLADQWEENTACILFFIHQHFQEPLLLHFKENLSLRKKNLLNSIYIVVILYILFSQEAKCLYKSCFSFYGITFSPLGFYICLFRPPFFYLVSFLLYHSSFHPTQLFHSIRYFC